MPKNEFVKLDPTEALAYRQFFPVDDMRIEAGDTVWTTRLRYDPHVLGGRVYYRVGFRSQSGHTVSLTVVFRSSDLLSAPDYSRWALFFMKHWLTTPEPERQHQLFF